MKYIFLLAGIIYCLSAEAHDPDRAFFDIREEASGVTVLAEFPWTLRNALISYDSALKKATVKTQFQEVFLSYCREKIVLTDTKGKEFELLSVSEVQNHSGHSHGQLFELKFSGPGKLAKIRNTAMHDHLNTQENSHRLFSEADTVSFKTLRGTAEYIYREEEKGGIINLELFLSLGAALLFLVIMFFMMRRKKPEAG